MALSAGLRASLLRRVHELESTDLAFINPKAIIVHFWVPPASEMMGNARSQSPEMRASCPSSPMTNSKSSVIFSRHTYFNMSKETVF